MNPTHFHTEIDQTFFFMEISNFCFDIKDFVFMIFLNNDPRLLGT